MFTNYFYFHHCCARVAFLASLCALLLVSSGCSEEQKQKLKQKRSKQVEVTVVVREPIKVTRIIPGTLETVHSVQIFNQEEGRINRIPFYEGDKVNKDELLVELDARLIQAQLDKASAALKQANLDLRRLIRLRPRKLASEDELARAETAVEQARAETVLLQTRLEHTRIRAPFAGIISARYKEPGDVVPIHSHILSLIDATALKATFNVSEILLSNLPVNSPVSLRIDALGEQRHTARILRVHPVVDALTRQGILEVLLDPVPAGAVPGQLSRLYISTTTNPIRTIPLAALRQDASGEYVYRVDDKHTSRYTRVTTGLQLNGRVEILDGLDIGDKVVLKGIIGLRDGQAVKIAGENKGTQTKKSASPSSAVMPGVNPAPGS